MATKAATTKRRRKISTRASTASVQTPVPAVEMPETDPKEKPFTPRVLDRTAIAMPLLDALVAEENVKADGAKHKRKFYPVIIDLNLEYPGGRDAAGQRIKELVREIIDEKKKEWDVDPDKQGINQTKSAMTPQYLFGTFDGRVIRELIRRDRPPQSGSAAQQKKGWRRAIYRIWPDFAVKALLTKSISTIKADAALNSFASTGEGIVWAVMDSGIDATHPHFAVHDNLNLTALPPLRHRNISALDGGDTGALVDKFGHGTHVAGIIAGAMTTASGKIVAESRFRDEHGEVRAQAEYPKCISGMAPKCKLLSLKVLDDKGEGQASSLIAAIGVIQEINGYGRYIRVQGVNMSVGYDFEPEWFACGQSPLCVEVDRLVKSGVVVVVAAGNSGYGWATTAFRGTVAAGLGLTINDPGNADLAVTVGSTHREMPHIYGVSYFSSKGPTGDGRAKPDVVAPGEKIISCASGWQKDDDKDDPNFEKAVKANALRMTALDKKLRGWSGPQVPTARKRRSSVIAQYREDSGTSMAAPHVSGAIAAFLSVRREFIGRPERLKEIFLASATDLKREPYFQGHGLIDLMRAIQSV